MGSGVESSSVWLATSTPLRLVYDRTRVGVGSH